MKYEPYAYQQHATEHVIENESCALFLDMGLGKTVSTLTAIQDLLLLDVNRVLVIAPLKVAQSTWSTEINKWDHLKGLRISKVLGTENQRKKALRADADIYVINRENVAWLVGYYGGSYFPFDAIIIDELSSFKSAKSIRFKALRSVRPLVKRVIGLTGTPAPNSLIDLWPQLYLLDRGERLGNSITKYRQEYFNPGQRNGHVVYDYKIKNGGEQRIYDKISDICISMKAKDYLELPERIDNVVSVELSEKMQKRYKDFERKRILELMQDELISVANAAGLTNKLLQFANGAVYDDNKAVKSLHSAKLDALDEIVESANGSPVLVFYAYKHDLDRIKRKLKAYKPRKLENEQDIVDWNDGKIQVLLAHPASAGHGLNLQAGGNIIVWFGLTWSLELYQQANARLYRQGQKNNVIIHHLIAKDTMDADVMAALSRKEAGQELLLSAVKARVEQIKNEEMEK